MTRETKIGLLVGLAFVLVVGILLSEHLTSATERPAAELAIAGRSIRSGVSAPGQNDSEAVAPTQPVPIARDLTATVTTAAPIPQVTITTPAPAPAAPPTQTIIVQAPQAPIQQAPITIAPPVVAQLPTQPATDPFANDPIKQIARIAQQQGEPLMPVDSKVDSKIDPKGNDVTPSKPQIPGGDIATVATTHSYKAQAGDTLNKLAAKLPGGSSKASRDAIVALNPTLQKDPNKIIVGRTYLLPTDVKTVATAPVTTPGAIVTVAQAKADNANKALATVPAAEQPTPDSPTAARIYVVKPGDTLSKIASAELGSKSHVDEIRKLNEDKLKGGDKITVDMKLKLPTPTA